jgi:hypothetical protein
MASGFAISVLVVECYVTDDRDDIALYETMKTIRNRLNRDLEIKHPVRNEMLTKGTDDPGTKFLRDKLTDALDNLDILFGHDCTRLEALKAWKDVYSHQFWANRVCDEEAKEKEKSKQQKAEILRGGNSGLALAAGITAAVGLSVARAKQTEAYGGKKNW